jgi:hypothetical protein
MTGFSYCRWRKGLDVQLLKRKRDVRADGLRTILLLEADFNLNNKAMGSDTMRSGDCSNAYTPDNFGECKGYRTQEVGTNPTLRYCMTAFEHVVRGGRAIVVSNDAKGCFKIRLHTYSFGLLCPDWASRHQLYCYDLYDSGVTTCVPALGFQLEPTAMTLPHPLPKSTLQATVLAPRHGSLSVYL